MPHDTGAHHELAQPSPNLYSPDANQGRGPIPVPREDTVDAERGAQALVLDVVFAICIALILWVVFSATES
jgi:hypothetical protein